MSAGVLPRGFAAMNQSRRRELASKGGHAAHSYGAAHKFNVDEARKAGRKGGQIVSKNRSHMARIGKKGGRASGLQRRNGKSNGVGIPAVARDDGALSIAGYAT